MACCLVFALAARSAGAEPPKPKDGPLGMKFVPLPKATTYLGWDGKEGSAKKTEIKEDFEIAIHTVTQGQWQELMGKNPSYFSRAGGGKNLVKAIKDEDLKQFPVDSVSWNKAQEYIKMLNEKEKESGYLYRLPTCAEWEYACRGGATSEEECSFHFYFYKPTNDLSSKQANINGNYPFGNAEKGPYLERTTKVGSYAPNKLGLYDMHGNVWQWCVEDYDPKGSPQRNKGGGWNYTALHSVAAMRYRVVSDNDGHLGLRLVRVPVRAQDK